MANIAKMLKQAQQMQGRMAQMQEEMAQLEKSFRAGGGAVEVVARGDQTITRIAIKPEAVDPDDVEALEDLLLMAVNGALDAVKTEAAARMREVTGGINIPGLNL